MVNHVFVTDEFLKACHKILKESYSLNSVSYTWTSQSAIIHVEIRVWKGDQVKYGKILYSQIVDITSPSKLTFSALGTHKSHWEVVSQ